MNEAAPPTIEEVRRQARLRDDADRRGLRRVRAGFTTQIVRVEERDVRPPQRAFVVNISGGGLLLRSDYALSPGDRIILALTLPGSALSVAVQAEAVRRQRHADGETLTHCRFRDISWAGLHEIVMWVRAQTPGSY